MTADSLDLDGLIRRVRRVPVDGRTTSAPTGAGTVDLRVRDGVVTEVAPRLVPVPEDAFVHDAEGRWAIPGLWDQHVHLGQWAATLTRLDMSGTASAAEAVDRVRAHLSTLSDPDEAVIGFGHRSAVWDEPATVAGLDAVSGDRPVALISGDAHNGWLNSAAQRFLDVPPTGGPLTENDWFAVLPRVTDLPGITARESGGYRVALRRAAAAGVVGVVDFDFGDPLSGWTERFGPGYDTLRVRVATYPDTLNAVLGAGLRTGDPIPGCAGLVTMGPLKIISDGSLNTRTAHCHEPYADAPDGSRGASNVSPDVLGEWFTRARAGGLRVAIHAIGDAAASTALDVFAATGARGSIEHVQLITVADIARMARLGVAASVQPAHLLDDRDVTMLCWPDRAERCFALGSMRRAGVELRLGSDAPVSPLDPWLAMAAAVHRTADDRPAWTPSEALTPAQALAASTDGQGTLGVGSRADIVLLDADPLAHEQPAEAAVGLRSMPVAATFAGGRPVFLR
ncbi:MAG: amidohydrolase family protein [Micropruina sp.]|nr:amidohydrolase family protein [Micropruina sp.]